MANWAPNRSTALNNVNKFGAAPISYAFNSAPIDTNSLNKAERDFVANILNIVQNIKEVVHKNFKSLD